MTLLCQKEKYNLSQIVGVIPRDISDEVNESGPSKIRKITSVAQQHGISAVDHTSSDTEKYNVLKSKQSFDKSFGFLKTNLAESPMENPTCTHFPSVG